MLALLGRTLILAALGLAAAGAVTGYSAGRSGSASGARITKWLAGGFAASLLLGPDAPHGEVRIGRGARPEIAYQQSDDHKARMRHAAKVAAKTCAAIKAGDHHLIVVNFAAPDMVGHTGKLDAAVEAVQAVDQAIGAIVEAVAAAQGALLITSDHGNCEQMADERGKPHTCHSHNAVPFIYVNDADGGATLRGGGSLADVAPTVLELLAIEQPDAMTGRSLRVAGD